MYREECLIDIDAISASEVMTMPIPKKVQIYDQNRPANPPSTSPCVVALSSI